MRGRRVGTRLLVAFGLLLAVDRVLLHATLDDGYFLGHPVAPFDPPLFSPAQEERLALIERSLATGDPPPESLHFDGELGWCNPREGGRGEFRYDWAGCRIGSGGPLPRTKAPGVTRVVAVGCSMTHGEEVAASETWCSRVDEALPELEVANLGVSAYGLDQSLLRLRRDGFPLEPDEVWMGLLPSAALRITTLYRPLLRHWSRDVAIKPRFVLGKSGELELVPSPARELADVPLLLRDTRRFLAAFAPHDPWIQRALPAYLPRGTHWTHHTFTTRLALTVWEAGGRDTVGLYADPENPVRRLLTRIVTTARDECAARGIRFVLLLLPSEDDLALVDEAGAAYWDDWVHDLAQLGVETFDVRDALLGPPAEGLFAPLGHYGPDGSRLVARSLVDWHH